MSDSITVRAISTRVAHTFRVDFNGLDEVEQTLKSTGGVGRNLTKYWRFSIKIIQESEIEQSGGEAEVSEKPQKPGEVSIYISAVPSDYEYNDLCNLWARKFKWGLKLQSLKSGLTVFDYKLDKQKTDTYTPGCSGVGASLTWGWGKFVTRDLLFENPNVKVDDGFALIFSLEELGPEIDRLFKPHTSSELLWKASQTTASELLDPQSGDVKFEIRDKDEGVYFLSAQKQILAANSEYFKSRFDVEWDRRTEKEERENPNIPWQIQKDYEGGTLAQIERIDGETLDEGEAEPTAVNSKARNGPKASMESETSIELPVTGKVPERPRDQRTIIVVDDVDFTTMHNILYYLYTGRVNLHFSEKKPGPTGYPQPADPFSLYRAANMYMLEELENRCCHYLQSTLHPENLVERFFDNPECAHHDRIHNMFLEYLKKNFDSIKKTEDWQDMWLGMKDCSEEQVEYKSRLLFEITSQMSFGAN